MYRPTGGGYGTFGRLCRGSPIPGEPNRARGRRAATPAGRAESATAHANSVVHTVSTAVRTCGCGHHRQRTGSIDEIRRSRHCDAPFWSDPAHRVPLTGYLVARQRVSGPEPTGHPRGSAGSTRTVGRQPSEQAHVPAEQSPARQDPRVPAAHAHQGRARDHLGTPDQGAGTPFGVAAATGEIMLAVGQRLRRRTEFTAAVRSGRRVGRGVLVVHLLAPTAGSVNTGSTARVGFVIPKSVGTAVARNKIRRRLRHLARVRLAQLPPGTDLVIRALPGAASRSYAQLRSDLEAAIAAASAPRSVRRSGPSPAQRVRRRPVPAEKTS